MDIPKAGFLRRLTALTVDVVILEFLGIMVTYPLQEKFDLSTDDILNPLLTGTGVSGELLLFILLYLTLVMLLWGFYFTFFIGWSGQTPGKKLMGLRVQTLDGRPMNYHVAFNRFIGYTVSGSLFMIGFLWMLFDPNKQTWHDKMAQTIVVKV